MKELINKNKSSEEIEKVLNALRKQFREIAEGVNGKAKVNREDEVDGPVEMEEVHGKPQKYQILVDFINDMNTLIHDPKTY